jgi:hypothetical protein
MEIVSSLAKANGMHDETEMRLAHRPASTSQGYTLLAAYADSNHILPYRISLRVTARQDSVCASLSERRWWTQRQSSRYHTIEEALTNAFAEPFGQGTGATRSH